MKKFAIAALAASTFLGVFSAAHAEDGQMRVNLAGVNTTTEAGAKTALARIRFSAANFCEQTGGRAPLERVSAEDRCAAAMTRKSVQQLNAPMVSALLDGGSKPSQLASR